MSEELQGLLNKIQAEGLEKAENERARFETFSPLFFSILGKPNKVRLIGQMRIILSVQAVPKIFLYI